MLKILKKTVTISLATLCLLGMMPSAVSAENDAGQIVIACVGDSITQGIGSTSPTVNSYPAKLQKELGDRYEVVNCGMSGSTLMVNNGAPCYRNYDPYKLSLSCNPDIVIIMLGTNDSKPQYWAYKDNYVDQLVALAKEYQELDSKPTVYIATSAYVPKDLDGITDAVVTKELAPLQKNAARRARCEVIDINAFTQGHDDWFMDGVHPGNDGYAKLAGYFADYISERHDVPIVDDLTERLNALPNSLSKDDISKVETLLFLFERLTERQKKLVTDADWKKLEAAEQAIKNLQTPTVSTTVATTVIATQQTTELPSQTEQITTANGATQSTQPVENPIETPNENAFPWIIVPVAVMLIGGITGLVLWVCKKKTVS